MSENELCSWNNAIIIPQPPYLSDMAPCAFCTMIMLLLTLHCLFMKKKKNSVIMSLLPYFPDMAPCDFCTMIMHLFTLNCLFVEQYCNDATASIFSRHGPMWLFYSQKLRKFKGYLFYKYNNIKNITEREIKGIRKIAFWKCFRDWKKLLTKVCNI